MKVKYAFLFKDHEDRTPAERRWKWVKEECYPEDLVQLIEFLRPKKGKKTEDAGEE